MNTSDSPSDAAGSVDRFQAAFAEYLRWNQRGQGPLTADRGQKVRIALVLAFKGISPSEGEIRSEVAARGFAIKRRKNKSGRTLTVEEEMKARIRSRRFLSASFVTPGWRKSSNEDEGVSGRFTALNRGGKTIGSVLVKAGRDEPAPRVSISSILAGVIEQDRRRDIVDHVLSDQAADMAVYVQRKHAEFIAARLVGDFRTTISI